jgi:hypothetical protein
VLLKPISKSRLSEAMAEVLKRKQWNTSLASRQKVVIDPVQSPIRPITPQPEPDLEPEPEPMPAPAPIDPPAEVIQLLESTESVRKHHYLRKSPPGAIKNASRSLSRNIPDKEKETDLVPESHGQSAPGSKAPSRNPSRSNSILKWQKTESRSWEKSKN